MEDAFRFADDLGPEKIIHIHEPRIGLRAILVIDNVAVGPSIGGIRMVPDIGLAECVRLARAMTLKNAAAGLPHGGGKSMISGEPKMPCERKARLIRAFARAIEPLTDYIPGPDMGTDETCMAWIKDEIGRAVGLPREIGGIPLDEVGATGFGLAASIDVAKDFCGITLRGARVAVQGFGAVGKHAARFLTEKGAVLVAAADAKGTIVDPAGLDALRLIEHKDTGQSVVEFSSGKALAAEAIVDVECEICIPAARPDVLRADNVGRLKTKLVAQGANIPATAAAETAMHRRGILSIPDFIANAGGVICAAVEYRHGTAAAAFQIIEEKIRSNTRAVLEGVKASGREPRAVALDLAAARVKRAMTFERWAD